MKSLLFASAAAVIVATSAAIVQDSNNSASYFFYDSLPRPISTMTNLNTNRTEDAQPRPHHVSAQISSFKTFQVCRLHIEKNFRRLTAVRQIAMECHVSVDALNRSFQHYGHQDPYRFLMNLKTNQTTELLRQKNESISSRQNT
jgi:transcriptional regulator GlxA family with amidase domain